MGLYICRGNVETNRSVETIFSVSDNGIYLSPLDEPIFTVNEGENPYKRILDFAEKTNITAYEICFDVNVKDADESFIHFVHHLANYLLDKDLSIGVLINDPSFLDDKTDELDRLGVTFSKHRHHVNAEKLECAKPKLAPKMRFPNRGIPFEMLQSAGPKHPSSNHMMAMGTILLSESFHSLLLQFIRESGKENPEIYLKGGISKQVFSKIISTPALIPTKPTVICLIIGLELPYYDATRLLLSAGYALSNSIAFDAIIAKYLKHEHFDLDLINSELDEYGCPLLGWHPREK